MLKVGGIHSNNMILKINHKKNINKRTGIKHLKKIHKTTRLEQKVLLWKQMQSMVITIEERNHKMMSFGTVVPAIVTVLNILFEKSTNEMYLNFYICTYLAIPLIMLLVIYHITFNNKYSAIIRGYLAGLEESINKDLKETLFLYNKGYEELCHGKFFLTNDIVAVLYSFVMISIPAFCFYSLFEQTKQVVLIALYIAFYIGFLSVFLYDLFTNGKTKKYAKIYFCLHNGKMAELHNNFRRKDINLIEKMGNDRRI